MDCDSHKQNGNLSRLFMYYVPEQCMVDRLKWIHRTTHEKIFTNKYMILHMHL